MSSFAARYPDELPRNFNRDKDRCKHGHEFTDENTYRHGGRRYCRVCLRRRFKEWKERDKTSTLSDAGCRLIPAVAPATSSGRTRAAPASGRVGAA